MEEKRLEEIKKGVEEIAKGYSSGDLRKDLAKTALEAIKEMAETALKLDQ